MNLGSVFTTIGDAGNQFADAKLQAYDQRIKQLMDKLGVSKEKTQIDELQERLRRLKLQPEDEQQKFAQTISSFKSVFGRDPSDQEKQVLFGIAAPRPPVKSLTDMWREEHPKGTAEELQEFLKENKPEKKVDVKMTGDFVSEITDADGKSYRGHDPELPENLKAIVKEYESNAQKSEETRATREAKKNADALNRAMQIGDMREAQKQRDEVFKTAKRGISGHSFLKTIAQQVNDAELSGGVGNKWGDMLIAEGFMQLMFGVDPKALRGSPKMMETLLSQQGGWDDRGIAEMNKAINGGRMSQAVREQALKSAQQQIDSWDQQIRQTGMLVDDPKTRALIQKYFNSVTAGEDAAMTGLGGKPH